MGIPSAKVSASLCKGCVYIYMYLNDKKLSKHNNSATNND